MRFRWSSVKTVLIQCSRGISYQARYSCDGKEPITCECRHIVYVLSPGVLTWSVGMLSIFYTVRMTDLGSKTGYRTLKTLKMSSNSLIHQGGN